MLDQVTTPCFAVHPVAQVVGAVGAIVTTCLTSFLAVRRVQKDKLDQHRWSTCPLQSDSIETGNHRHRPRTRKSDVT